VNTEQMIAAGVGTALMLGGAISAFGGRLRIPAIGDEPINSDKPAPEGTADYVTLVMAASPDCTPAGQLEYLLAELTEAQTLRSEVNRKLPTVTHEAECNHDDARRLPADGGRVSRRR
jgi:hypothetical protein